MTNYDIFGKIEEGKEVDMTRQRREKNREQIALLNYPYFILRNEVNSGYNDYYTEVQEIAQNYLDYRYGVQFYPEGTSGSYTPAQVHFKNAKILLDKEARFMFSQPPDINIQAMSTNEGDKKQIEQYQKMVDQVLKKSEFFRYLLLSAKDCFIGKRVACLVDYSARDGIKTRFYNALHFYYEKETDSDRLTKFVCFKKLDGTEKRYLVTKYEVIEDKVYTNSIVYTSGGVPEVVLIPDRKTDLKEIPAVIIFNDGTLEDSRGVSEIESLIEHEEWYNNLANNDIDSGRKGMNPIKYVVDMNGKTTANLPSGPGAFWDLKSEQNQNEIHPLIGSISPQLTHTEAIKATLDRIKSSMYGEVDVPNISEDGLLSGITSFKALRALYFPLETRCNEKLMTWKPAIERIIHFIIELAILNKTEVMLKYVLTELNKVQYNVEVVENYALLADETEEKETDLQEIGQNTRSRKSYIEKWRKSEFKTDDAIEEELMQIAVELNMFDTSSINTVVQKRLDGMATSEEIREGIETVKAEQAAEGVLNDIV